jgi:hypothetical protein
MRDASGVVSLLAMADAIREASCFVSTELEKTTPLGLYFCIALVFHFRAVMDDTPDALASADTLLVPSTNAIANRIAFSFPACQRFSNSQPVKWSARACWSGSPCTARDSALEAGVASSLFPTV